MSGLPSLLALMGFVTVVVGGSVIVVAAFGVDHILWGAVIFLAAALFVALTGGFKVWRDAVGQRQEMEEERDEARRERDDARYGRDEAQRDLEEARRKAVDHFPESIVRSKRVHLADLVRDQHPPIIAHKVFHDCDIVGPAMIALNGGSTQGCHFYGPGEEMIIPVSDDAPMHGAILLLGCDLLECRIDGLGLLVPESQVDDFKRGFRIHSPGEDAP